MIGIQFTVKILWGVDIGVKTDCVISNVKGKLYKTGEQWLMHLSFSAWNKKEKIRMKIVKMRMLMWMWCGTGLDRIKT